MIMLKVVLLEKNERVITMSENKPVSKTIRTFQWSLPILFAAVCTSTTAVGSVIKPQENESKENHLGNAKDIFIALFEFAKDHDGLFPCDKTGPATTAEDCFNQLLAGGYLKNEDIFWSKASAKSGIVSTRPPNNDGILTAEENSWGYVKGLNTSSRTNLPILFNASIKPGEFRTDIFKGQVVVAKLDGSVQTHKIHLKSSTDNSGTLIEKRGSQDIDIFKYLPESATILPSQSAK